MGRSNKKSAEAGAKNLAKWQAENPDFWRKSSYRHGAFSMRQRQRYSDRRTTEGKQLKAIMEDIRADLGQEHKISGAQRLLLDGIRSKIIVLLQISSYVDKQPSIVNDKGEVISCLSNTYRQYTDSLRKDLQALHLTTKRPESISYEKALKALEGGRE
jgi:hypothetical protein